jgi:surface antigen
MKRYFSWTYVPVVCAAALTAAVVTAPQAHAQDAANGCEAPRQSGGRSIGRSILGRVLGEATSRAANTLGSAARFVPSAEFADTLTDAIACRLDDQEQRKAADATLEATRGGEVGTTVEWTSESRANVSGRSTVTARTNEPNGQQCMVVEDVIYVNGEETLQPKRMCRRPPTTRYTLAA